MSNRDSFKETWKMLKSRGFFDGYDSYEKWELRDEPKTPDEFIVPKETPEEVARRKKWEKESKEGYKTFKGHMSDKDKGDFEEVFGVDEVVEN